MALRSRILCLLLIVGASYASVPSGYTMNRDTHRAYRVHTDRVTWAVAKQTCINEGGHLAVLNNQDEANEVKNYLSSRGVGHSAWVGIHRVGNSNFITVGNQAMGSTGYERWKTGPTSKGSGKDCLVMWTCGRYSDRECIEEKPFICEQEFEILPGS